MALCEVEMWKRYRETHSEGGLHALYSIPSGALTTVVSTNLLLKGWSSALCSRAPSEMVPRIRDQTTRHAVLKGSRMGSPARSVISLVMQTQLFVTHDSRVKSIVLPSTYSHYCFIIKRWIRWPSSQASSRWLLSKSDGHAYHDALPIPPSLKLDLHIE
jgi:hypothetical protein